MPSLVWKFMWDTPVLAFGSAHLSLMAVLGIYLWIDPSNFGRAQLECNPSISIVGASVPFLSQGLRIVSLTMYSLFLIPGVNLLPPFLFFITLHIGYNWMKFTRPVHRFLTKLRSFRAIPAGTIGREKTPPTELERAVPLSDRASNVTVSKGAPDTHVAGLNFGFGFLAALNIIFIIDIELTLRRNKGIQDPGEGEWSFGQVLALLLLIIPIRDLLRSIIDIVKKEASKSLQSEAAAGGKGIGFDSIRKWIGRGADPDVQFIRKGVPVRSPF